MKYSYNWLKWYIPEVLDPEKLADVLTYHLAEVENVEHRVFNNEEDLIFDIKILPNRAHDLLSHQGLARELASLLNIKFIDPTLKYKIPPSTNLGQAQLKIKIETDKCRRYMGRIVRNIKIGPSPDWVVKHLESIEQRSINNVVDAANLGMAGIKGGKIAEVDANTKNIIIEVANFDPISVRKSARYHGLPTNASKRFENELTSEPGAPTMREISGLLVEYGTGEFEEIVDEYSQKPETRTLSFSIEKISKILGLKVSEKEIEEILIRYHFKYNPYPTSPLHKGEETGGGYKITVPPMRLDLEIEEDMAEEIGRVLGYDKVKGTIPRVSFTPKVNQTYAKIVWARNKLLNEGYSEVMTSSFCMKGKMEVLASASDKNFLRINLLEGLKESLKLNKNNLP